MVAKRIKMCNTLGYTINLSNNTLNIKTYYILILTLKYVNVIVVVN